jgi:hypothetical protein
MKYLRGPWKLHAEINVVDINGNFVASCGFNAKNSLEIAKANASLIASAPELLEALKNLISFHENSTFITDCPEKMAVNLSEQAIAKAEGEII